MAHKLLPVRVKESWLNRERDQLSSDECYARQQEELDACARIWIEALLLPGENEIVRSTLVEIARHRGVNDLELVRRRCESAVHSVKSRWEQTVQRIDAERVERFYDQADDYIDELMWWHTLTDDNSPLAYVAALEFATSAGCKTYLDFGSGVGSGALLFRAHGFDVTLADISSVLLSFCMRRFSDRELDAQLIDLKQARLPEAAFDFITAMDVFEHLVDPAEAVELLYRSLRPGGYIYGRFAGEQDPDRPQHIVHDFSSVFDRFTALGFKEVFRDDWLWGHQVFQKTR